MNRTARFMALAGASAGLLFCMCGCGWLSEKLQNKPREPQKPYVAMAGAENPIFMPDANKVDAVIVTVPRDGAVFLGSYRTEISDLSSQVRDRLADRVNKEVYIRADARAKYRTVEDVIDSLRPADVDEIGLLVFSKSADAQHSYLDLQSGSMGLYVLAPSASTSKQGSLMDPQPISTFMKGAIVVKILYEPTGTPAYKINQVDAQKAELLPRLTEIYKNRAERVLFIRGDDKLDFASVAEVIDFAKGAGVDHVAVLTPQMIAGH